VPRAIIGSAVIIVIPTLATLPRGRSTSSINRIASTVPHHGSDPSCATPRPGSCGKVSAPTGVGAPERAMWALTNPTVAQLAPSHVRVVLGLRINLQRSSGAPEGKVRRSRTARGVVSGSDGYYQTAPGVRKARAAAMSPATLCALQIARFILIVLALIGTVAITRLVLGLLNVHAVTNHFHIH
jgi:hypothetical protein